MTSRRRQPAPAAHIGSEWPADHVRRVRTADLVPSARNARTHSAEQVQQLTASIREWGWTVPVLVDEQNEIIAGHGRVMAAALLGLDDIPVMTAVGWSDERKRAYRLADNKLALNSGWDDALLRAEIEDLQNLAFDVGLIGFSGDEIDALLLPRAIGNTDPDDVPPVPEVPTTRSGDVWICGRHRIICGNSTVQLTVEQLLAGVAPGLMVTDPPYGVLYDPTWRNRAGVSNTARTGKVANDDQADWRDAWALFPGDTAYVWHSALHSHEVAAGLIASGFTIRSQIIWAKESLVMGRGHYHWQHEPCWYAARGRAGWTGDRKQTTLWHIATRGQDQETTHGTQKPVECMRRPIVNNSSPGQAIYEPFSGSGTTMIACEMEGRNCMAIEIMPEYVDVAVLRWQAFSGGIATLDRDGRTFAAVAVERASP